MYGPAGDGPPFHGATCRTRAEGIVSKRLDAPYATGERGLRRKTKCLNREEFIIVGYTDPEGSRPYFGALLLGYRLRLAVQLRLLRPPGFRLGAGDSVPKGLSGTWAHPCRCGIPARARRELIGRWRQPDNVGAVLGGPRQDQPATTSVFASSGEKNRWKAPY